MKELYCECKKPSEITRLHIKFNGKKKYFVETCLNCDRKVPEKDRLKDYIMIFFGFVIILTGTLLFITA